MQAKQDGTASTRQVLTRRAFSALAGGAALAALVRGRASARTPGDPQTHAPPRAQARNIVLVHGAFADGSCWADVIGRLQAAGLNATAVQNPLTSLADDVAATRRALARQSGPTVLVGHSWAGTVISEAGDAPGVSALVYIAARAPDAGEDFVALAGGFPTPPGRAGIHETDGVLALSEEAFVRDFAGDVPRARARVLYAAQQPAAAGLFASRTSVAAWRSVPSWYAVSTEDRIIAPELQRFLSRRMKATAIELAASHLSMISHAKDVAELILAAAAGR